MVINQFLIDWHILSHGEPTLSGPLEEPHSIKVLELNNTNTLSSHGCSLCLLETTGHYKNLTNKGKKTSKKITKKKELAIISLLLEGHFPTFKRKKVTFARTFKKCFCKAKRCKNKK